MFRRFLNGFWEPEAVIRPCAMDCAQLLALTARVGELSLVVHDQSATIKEMHHMLSTVLDPDFTPPRGTPRPSGDLEG